MPEFDSVVVGGSPAMIARAAALAADGHRTLLVEAHTELGGSWRLASPFGDGIRYDAFEHLLAGGDDARTLLREGGVPLRDRPIQYSFSEGITPEEQELVAEIYQGGDRSGLDARPLLLPVTEGRFVHALRRGRMSIEEIAALRTKYADKRVLTKRRDVDRNIYFHANVDDLLRPLLRSLERSNVKVLTSATVETVEDADFVKISGDFGTTTARQAVLGRYYSGRVVSQGVDLPIERSPRSRLTLITRIASSRPQASEYVKLVDWGSVSALQKVSTEDTEPAGVSTYCLYLFGREFDGCDALAAAKQLVPALVAAGVFNPDSVADRAEWLRFEYQVGPDTAAPHIAKKTDGRVSIVSFTSLGRDIGSNPEVWKKALQT